MLGVDEDFFFFFGFFRMALACGLKGVRRGFGCDRHHDAHLISPDPVPTCVSPRSPEGKVMDSIGMSGKDGKTGIFRGLRFFPPRFSITSVAAEHRAEAPAAVARAHERRRFPQVSLGQPGGEAS